MKSVSNIPLYAHSYLVASPKDYTKHYYYGSQRIASKLGMGGLSNLTQVNAAMTNKANALFQATVNYTSDHDMMYWVQEKEDTDGMYWFESPWGSYEEKLNDKQSSVPRISSLSASLQGDMFQTLSDFDKEQGLEKEVYYYHSDHLGSASWITDESGSPIQHLQYLPFGEPFVDQWSSSVYTERFTFTGKERDEELRSIREHDKNEKNNSEQTGYYYFDARYLWSTIGFLSVDPLSDKYPSLSPYMYCAGNPVRLVDPNGMEVVISGDKESVSKAIDQMQSRTKNLTFSRDDNGRISATGEAKTKEEQYMMNIINSQDITVNITAQSHSNIGNGSISDAGAFMGNSIGADENGNSHVTGSQIINVNKSAEADKQVKSPGNFVWHEIAEGFEAGKISLSTGKSAKPAITERTEKNAIYKQGHYNAGAYFPGTITKTSLAPMKIPGPKTAVTGMPIYIERNKYNLNRQ